MNQLAAFFGQYDPIIWIICLVATTAAGMARGFAGFGAGMIISPTFAAFLGPAVGVPLLQVLDGLLQVWIVPANFRRIRWREALFFAIIAAVTMPLGLLALKLVDPKVMTLFIAALAAVCGLAVASGWRYRGPVNRRVDALVAAVAGALSGATSLSGPPLIIYSMASGDPAERVRARINGFFAFSSLFALCWYGLAGLITWNVLFLGFALLPVYIAATAVGHFLFPYASERLFKRLVTVLILSAAALATARALLG